LKVGIAYTDDPSSAKLWTRLPEPVLPRDQLDCRYWEEVTQYKSNIIDDKERSLGYPFVMFYNGKPQAPYERMGMAVSHDIKTRLRYGVEPVIHNPRGIAGDPQITRIGDVWVMFYFGAFWKPGAFDSFACSYDRVVDHFYFAVGDQRRVIALAASKDLNDQAKAKAKDAVTLPPEQ